MKLQVYSVRDVKTALYHPPFCAHNDDDARRMFHRFLQNPQMLMAMYPNDFECWHLGEFNDATGQLASADEPKRVCSAVDVLQAESEDSNE